VVTLLRRTKEDAAASLNDRKDAAARICFTPIWYPLDDYATSRLRAKYVAELFSDVPQWDVRIGYEDDADIAVIIQLCNHSNLERIRRNRSQFVIYDLCDRFFETDNLFKTDEGPLHAQAICLEVIERADALIVPSQSLREVLSRRFPGKPCFYVPELVDYRGSPRAPSRTQSRRLLWFGHTTRGNFQSARWIIDRLRSREGYTPVLVTTPGTLAARYPTYAPFCVPWSPQALTDELSRAGLCIATHHSSEIGKSPNRFVTATIAGVPTLVSPIPACVDILRAAGYADLTISTEENLDRAIKWLSSANRRTSYVYDLQREIWQRHAPEVIRTAYIELFTRILQQRASKAPS
jgi:hypothetical protein